VAGGYSHRYNNQYLISGAVVSEELENFDFSWQDATPTDIDRFELEVGAASSRDQ
jgi:hypothetical protein